MAALRSLLYAAIFYPATVLWVVIGAPVSLLGRKPTLAVVLSWVDMHHWLARHVLGIRIRVEGEIPRGPVLIAVKHQSMFETLEMVRITNLPIIVMKKELRDIPFFGFLTWRYGVIAVERSAGAKALRALVEGGREAVASGRPVLIYPEGTRVRVGETPSSSRASPRCTGRWACPWSRSRWTAAGCGAAASSIAAERSRSRSVKRSPPGSLARKSGARARRNQRASN